MAPRRGLGRLWGSVRVRTVAAATLVVAVALAVGAAIMVNRLQSSLDSNRRSAAVARALDTAALASSGQLPAVLPLSSDQTLSVQVVDGAGRVVASSADIVGEGPIGALARPGSEPTVRPLGDSPVDGSSSTRLVTVSGGAPGAPLTVFAVFSLVSNRFAVRDVTVALSIALPLLLAIVAAVAWIVIGRALRPIDAIRAEMAEITTRDLHRRVPEPPGGDEVARLARTVNRALDRLESSVERQRRFVDDASHELRSPLASLRTQLEVGLAGGDTTDWPATVAGALLDEQRIEQTVTDLLLLARLDQDPSLLPGASATGAPRPPTDLAAVVDEVVASVAGQGPDVRASSDGRAPVAVPESLCRRVVSNLVGNAVRHAGSEVVVTTARSEGWVELTVADDGPGVAPEDRLRVFERFTRLDAARASDDGGAGLGLAIVRDIVVRAGGGVGFVDTDRGAKVVLRLPAAVGA